MNPSTLTIHVVDPQGEDAMSLLKEAALEMRVLYADLFTPESPMPTNPPTPNRGIYLIGYVGGQPVVSGALRPIDDETVEIRRIFVSQKARRSGAARKMLIALEEKAYEFGYKVMRLETGNRQSQAMALYESYGFHRIEPFGEYRDNPTSVCFEKEVEDLRGNSGI